MTRPISILIFSQIKTDPNQTMLYGRRVLEEVVVDEEPKQTLT